MIAEHGARLVTVHDLIRPVTRGDCINGPRPCPWTNCRYHLMDSVSRGYHGTHPDVSAMQETCVLDIADKGGATLEECAQALLITRERVRQLEAKALRAAQRAIARAAHGRELREAVTGEKHRPDLVEAEDNAMQLGQGVGAAVDRAWRQMKERGEGPKTMTARNTKEYQRQKRSAEQAAKLLAELPRSPVIATIAREAWTNIATNTKESIMADTKFTEEDKQRTTAAQEEITARRQNGWSLSGIGRAIGKSISYLSAINAGKERCTRDIYEKIQALPAIPSEKPGKPAKAPVKNSPQLEKKPRKPAQAEPANMVPNFLVVPPALQATAKEIETAREQTSAQSPALARLDKEIAETEMRLVVLRDLRTKWAAS